jgi:hypothetical protein
MAFYMRRHVITLLSGECFVPVCPGLVGLAIPAAYYVMVRFSISFSSLCLVLAEASESRLFSVFQAFGSLGDLSCLAHYSTLLYQPTYIQYALVGGRDYSNQARAASLTNPLHRAIGKNT